jgi:hypothetical protein
MSTTEKLDKLNARQIPIRKFSNPPNNEQGRPTILIVVYSKIENAHLRDHWRKNINARTIDGILQLITVFYVGQPRNAAEEGSLTEELKNGDVIISEHEDHDGSLYLKGLNVLFCGIENNC